MIDKIIAFLKSLIFTLSTALVFIYVVVWVTEYGISQACLKHNQVIVSGRVFYCKEKK